MERISDEQTLPSAQTAEAEKGNHGAAEGSVSLGKFKNVNSLLNAYKSLEAEFTRRSVRLKELEGEAERRRVKEQSADGDSVSPDLSVGEREKESGSSGMTEGSFGKNRTNGSEKERRRSAETDPGAREGFAEKATEREIIDGFLREILQSAPAVTFGGGGRIAAPPRRPASLAEAGKLAEAYIENKKGDYLK